MANGITNIFTTKIFPATAPAGSQTQENDSSKSSTLPPLATNPGAGAALNHVTERFVERQNAAGKISSSANPIDGDAARPKTVDDFLSEVLRGQPVKIDDDNRSKVQISMRLDKPPEQMTRADYTSAFRRAVYERAMSGLKITDEEVKMADKALIAAGLYATGYNLFGTIDSLRDSHRQQGNRMPVSVGRQNLEYASRAGQAVLQFEQYQAVQADINQKRATSYATDALGGFIQPMVNAPVNIFNGVSEPFRAGERISFGTRYIPEIPRMQVAERSEYWNKDGRMVINRGAEITSTIVFGGAAGGKAIGTQAGRIFLGTESAYNIGAGVFGRDVTQSDAQGNARQMPLWERGLRVTGGVFGAQQTIKTEIATPNSAVNKLDDIFKNPPTIRPQGEFVTPEGFRIRTNVEQIPDNVLLSKAQAQETNSIGRRNLDSHEGVSGVREGKEIGHTILKHVGKSERTLQNRLLKEPNTPSASSFHNRSVGNRTVGSFKKLYEAEINQWLKSGKPEFQATIDMKENIGIVVNRNKKGTPLAAEEATKATIRLVKDNSEYGWHLFTVKLQK